MGQAMIESGDIPKEALDLYAWAVGVCSVHGYSVHHIRVAWKISLNSTWFFDGERWNLLVNRIIWSEGAYLFFENPDDVPSGVESDAGYVLLRPPHSWTIVEVVSSRVLLRCSKCFVQAHIKYNERVWVRRGWKVGASHVELPCHEGHIPVCHKILAQ